MGNVGSSHSRRRHGGGGGSGRRVHPPVTPPLQEAAANQFAHPAAAQPYQNYPNNYPPPASVPMPLPAPYDHHHRTAMDPVYGRYPTLPQVPAPYVEHQKAVTIRNDVNIKKETLRIEADEENPGQFLVKFTFDATVSETIAVLFFAKEGDGCVLTSTKENVLVPVIINFQQGLGQKFRQPAGTGINFSMFEESELLKVGGSNVYPVAVKADASSGAKDGSNETPKSGSKTNTNTSSTEIAVLRRSTFNFFPPYILKPVSNRNCEHQITVPSVDSQRLNTIVLIATAAARLRQAAHRLSSRSPFRSSIVPHHFPSPILVLPPSPSQPYIFLHHRKRRQCFQVRQSSVNRALTPNVNTILPLSGFISMAAVWFPFFCFDLVAGV